MNSLYKEIGISKQAVYQYEKRQAVFDQKVVELIVAADHLRKAHPGCGVEKMYHILKPDFIGRDRFVELMMNLGYRIKRKKNYKRTTISAKVYYPNLIKGMNINGASQVWQSDITYVHIGERFYYAVFIIDVYTRVIVGYCVSDSLRAIANLKALKMAFRDYKPPKIHHSDRGSQYIYKDYVAMLKDQNCAISMGLTAQDNAYAERINRTIKEEYLDYWKPKDLAQLKRDLKRAVLNYNTIRAHKNLGYQNPKDFEKKNSLLACQQRKTITIFDNGI